MMGGGPEISIVLPAHNEAGNIAPIAAAIAQAMALLGSYEIIFVDDGSTRRHARGDPRRGARSRRSAISRSRAISAIRRPCAPGCATRAGAP